MINKTNYEYERYIHSADWKKLADERLEIDNHKCCVCGKEATEVHHLTYDRFKNESTDDLVSLCHKCHNKAEELYNPTIIPWAMSETKPNNFMAAMRTDALTIAPIVYCYLKEVRGFDFDALMSLRQPDDDENKKYWRVLQRAVNALCRKRYYRNCAEDRRTLMIETITNHVEVICLAQIEHYIRNSVQKALHQTVMTEYENLKKWESVRKKLGITAGTLRTLRNDTGISFGPSLRETVLYYCGRDAAAGIKPIKGFSCLSKSDYEKLNQMADYMAEVSGDGDFKGETLNA